MKLTSKGRYAVMALADLAKFNSVNPVSLRDISLRQGISLHFLEQIFSKLKKYSIVNYQNFLSPTNLKLPQHQQVRLAHYQNHHHFFPHL